MDVGNTKECLNSPNGLHCWHGNYNSYSTAGNDQREVCCHCGQHRNLHGPYAPNQWKYTWPSSPRYTIECYGKGF